MSVRLPAVFAFFLCFPFGCEEPEPTESVAGTVHEPPIRVAEVPVGHWYCDMGTVEYTRQEKGDGKCPVCGMDLVHKTSPDQSTAHPDLLKKKSGPPVESEETAPREGPAHEDH